jgi:hypothetical protein
VKYPITNPAQSPETVQMNACHGALISLENTASPNLNDSGKVKTAARYNNGVKINEAINN